MSRPPQPPAVNGAPIILVAEDNPINGKIISAYLRKLSLPHHLVLNGLAALEYYTTPPPLRPPIAAILMDVSMPVMDGMEATRRVREFEARMGWERVRVVAMSASAMREDRARLVGEVGCDVVWARPLRMRDLEWVLGTEVVEGRMRSQGMGSGLGMRPGIGVAEGAVRRLGMVRGHVGGGSGGEWGR